MCLKKILKNKFYVEKKKDTVLGFSQNLEECVESNSLIIIHNRIM
jgi:hypothetical protein